MKDNYQEALDVVQKIVQQKLLYDSVKLTHEEAVDLYDALGDLQTLVCSYEGLDRLFTQASKTNWVLASAVNTACDTLASHNVCDEGMCCNSDCAGCWYEKIMNEVEHEVKF